MSVRIGPAAIDLYSCVLFCLRANKSEDLLNRDRIVGPSLLLRNIDLPLDMDSITL